MQVLEITLKVCPVVLLRQPIHAGCCVLLKFKERLFEQIDVDVVEERVEPVNSSSGPAIMWQGYYGPGNHHTVAFVKPNDPK
jgi:hypothetical protein